MDPQTVVLLLGALAPLLVAVATKRYAAPWVKVATNVVASALAAGLAHLATSSGAYDLADFWRALLEALVASAVAYEAVWQHTLVELIERTTGRWGLGTVALVPVSPGGLAVDGRGVVVAPAALSAAPADETAGD